MTPGMYNPLRQAGAQGIFKGEGAVEVGGHVARVVDSKIKMFGVLQIRFCNKCLVYNRCSII